MQAGTERSGDVDVSFSCRYPSIDIDFDEEVCNRALGPLGLGDFQYRALTAVDTRADDTETALSQRCHSGDLCQGYVITKGQDCRWSNPYGSRAQLEKRVDATNKRTGVIDIPSQRRARQMPQKPGPWLAKRGGRIGTRQTDGDIAFTEVAGNGEVER